MGFRGGGQIDPPPSVSWFSSTPAGIGLRIRFAFLKFIYNCVFQSTPLISLTLTTDEGIFKVSSFHFFIINRKNTIEENKYFWHFWLFKYNVSMQTVVKVLKL